MDDQERAKLHRALDRIMDVVERPWVLAGFAQLCLVGALKAAPPTVLAPLDYTVMLWAVGFDVILWHTAPSPQVLLGAAIIAAAGLFIAHRETAFFHSLWRALSDQISLRR